MAGSNGIKGLLDVPSLSVPPLSLKRKISIFLFVSERGKNFLNSSRGYSKDKINVFPSADI